MTIVELKMQINKGYRFNPEETSYHINREVAEKYREYLMKENPKKYTEYYWIHEMEVNEKIY